MEVLIGYGILCIVTAIWAVFYFWVPLLRDLKCANPKSVMLENKVVGFISFFSIAALATPLFIMAVMFPAVYQVAYDAILASWVKAEE